MVMIKRRGSYVNRKTTNSDKQGGTKKEKRSEIVKNYDWKGLVR